MARLDLRISEVVKRDVGRLSDAMQMSEAEFVREAIREHIKRSHRALKRKRTAA